MKKKKKKLYGKLFLKVLILSALFSLQHCILPDKIWLNNHTNNNTAYLCIGRKRESCVIYLIGLIAGTWITVKFILYFLIFSPRIVHVILYFFYWDYLLLEPNLSQLEWRVGFDVTDQEKQKSNFFCEPNVSFCLPSHIHSRIVS